MKKLSWDTLIETSAKENKTRSELLTDNIAKKGDA